MTTDDVLDVTDMSLEVFWWHWRELLAQFVF